jgi:iron complex outermembrane receptor protein
LAISAALAGTAATAWSAESDSESPVIAEVIVTVERVQQTLQSYEGTAAVVSQSSLDALGVTNLVDLPALIPGLEITNYEDNSEIYVRGIGSNANTELGDPAIATHLDDVYVPRPRGLGAAFFDLERVEVNVGPQGTVRGRNALGGSINIVSRKPKLNDFSGYAEYTVGNYSQKEVRGALNVPLGPIAAGRVAVFTATHDEYVKNTGPLTNLLGWESQDDVAARAHFLLEPSEQLSVLLSGDYLNTKGTGSRGIEMSNASLSGIEFNSVDDPRRINQSAFSPTQDTVNWGVTLNATYRTDWFNVQYIGGYRDLHYKNDLSNNGRNFDFPGDEAMTASRANIAPSQAQAYANERYYNSFGALMWDAVSESRTHELRFTSPDSADRLTWAVGLYKFKEEQDVFLGIPLDYSDLPYLEFNQGNVLGESKSAYADLTFALTDKLRITGGARYSDESKERQGFNFIAGFNTNGVAIRTGTPGFHMTGRNRTLTNPDADGDGVPGTLNDIVALYRAGIASFGVNDTLNQFLYGGCVTASQFGATCAAYTGLKLSSGASATSQFGENSDNYVDWRFRIGYDLTDNNLLYVLIATGNKAPSFNDTVDLDSGPGTNLYTPPVGPEKNTMYEIGSKNEFTVGGNPVVFNASAYYFKYTDQVFSTLVGIQLLDNDPSNDIGCTDTDPNTQCSGITLNQNVGRSRNMGIQLDTAYKFGPQMNLGATLLWQDTKYEHGSIVTDNRRNNPNGGTLQVDLGGNELPRTPPLTLNLRLGQDIDVSSGTVDWVISGTYKTSYYLTAFNGGAGDDGAKTVTAVDADGVATTYGADVLRLHDEVDSYVHLDLGVGYTHGDGNVRVEGFVNNVTDEAHASQATIDGSSQEFVFNPPRTYGLRVRVQF